MCERRKCHENERNQVGNFGGRLSILNDVTAVASGASYNSGVYGQGNSVVMKNSLSTATGGTMNWDNGILTYGTLVVDHCDIKGDTYSIYGGSTSNAKVVFTKLDGSAVGPNYACIGAYDANYTELGITCR